MGMEMQIWIYCRKKLKTKEKPTKERDFVEILRPMKETKHKPIYRYETANTAIIEYKGYKIICEIQKLNQVMEMLK